MPKKNIETSKLFELLKLLNPKECNRLKKCLQGSWPSQNATLLRLFNLIMPYYPDFQSDHLDREKLFSELFPNKPIDLNRLAALMSELTKQIERFLIHEKLLQNDQLQDELLIQIYQERGKAEWAKKRSDKRIEKLENKAVKDWEDLLHLCLANERQHRSYSFGENIATPEKQTSLFQANQYLDQFYKLGKYRFLLELAEREKILGETHQVTQQLGHLESIATQEYLPVLDIYQAYFKRKEESTANFGALKSHFMNNFQGISKLDQSILLLLLINNGARIRLKGNTTMISELLELYKIGIQHHLILYHTQLVPSTFANIVSLGNALEDFDFVQRFIDNFNVNLPDQIRTDAVIWAKTHLAFRSKSPKLWKVAKNLHELKVSKSTFAFRTRVLNIQMWFEDYLNGIEKDVNFMLAMCDTFNRQLRRNKMFAPNRLIAMRAFVKQVKALIRLKNRNRRRSVLQAKQAEIIHENNIYAKEWLLVQVSILIGDNP